MAGTVKGGLKARDTINTRYPGFYKMIGRKGGKISRGGGFASNPEFASEMGRKGGVVSRRTKAE